VTSRTVSCHVLEILSCLKKSRQLPDEELLRFSVELRRVIEATLSLRETPLRATMKRS
jgi:hypothetical protein